MWLSRKSGTVEPAEQVSLQWNTIGTYNAGGSNDGPTTTAGTAITIPSSATTYPSSIRSNEIRITPSDNAVPFNYEIYRGSYIID